MNTQKLIKEHLNAIDLIQRIEEAGLSDIVDRISYNDIWLVDDSGIGSLRRLKPLFGNWKVKHYCSFGSKLIVTYLFASGNDVCISYRNGEEKLEELSNGKCRFENRTVTDCVVVCNTTGGDK